MSGAPRLSYREIAPRATLVPYVDRFWMRTGAPASTRAPTRILPDGCIDLLIDVTG